jgi:N-glycosylase/DNA lyase
MQTLYNKLKHYTTKDAEKIEETDRQFLALQKLYQNLVPLVEGEQGELYLVLIISNALICYQLSGS